MGELMHASHVDGVVVSPRRRIGDDRGEVLHMLRADDPEFERFGEVYCSRVAPGAVKAWKRHRRMTQHLIVPVGRIRLVIHDARAGSPTAGATMALDVGEEHHVLVTVPPDVWYGFVGTSSSPALIVNCADLPHDPSEVDREPPDTPAIPYDWTVEPPCR